MGCRTETKSGERKSRNGVTARPQGAAEAAGPGFFMFMRDSVGAGELKGARERWLALPPCTRDFGHRRSRRGRSSRTVIALRLHGAAVEDHNRRVTRTSGPGRDFALQPAGHSDPISRQRRHQIRPGVPARRIARQGFGRGEPARLSGRLRDDLSFVPEKTLQTLTADYLRRAFDRRFPRLRLRWKAARFCWSTVCSELHDPLRPDVASLAGGLSPRHLRRACDFISEHLAEDICLDDLAELTGLTCKHFARAFRQSTGLPPHQYLVLQRIEAAKRRLVDARVSLADIALECGFADQSHFTAAFRKAVGVRPALGAGPSEMTLASPALSAGFSRSDFATYLPALYVAGVACVLAAALVLTIGPRRKEALATA